MRNPVLRLVDATVVKNGVPVLDRLTLTIRAGEHTAILGPNGAGKTSLINLLTHQDRALATDGPADPVEVFGESRWNIFELRTQVGIVSQDLHQRFVAGNSEGHIRGDAAVLSALLATYGLVRAGAATPAMRRLATEALARMDAGHLGAKLLSEMSTGEARRVLIARALVTAPQALVLDEPTAGLDIVARRRFLGHVSAIARSGTTVILVTHHVEDIIPEIEHVVFLKEGRVTLAGSKRTVLTAANLSALFDAPVALDRAGDRYLAKLATDDALA